MKKRTKSESGIPESSLRDRIAQVAEAIWHNRKSQMARDLGVEQASISRLLAGKQQPSAKILERIATWPGINTFWLFTGVGEMSSPVLAGGGRYLPVVDQLLPGPPEKQTGLLSGVSYPVAEAFFSKTRYWLRVPRGSTLGVKQKVFAGDLLLMETDSAWTRRWGNVLRAMCGVLISRRQKTQVILVRVSPLSESQNYFRRSFEFYPVETYPFRRTEGFASGIVKFVVPGPNGEMPKFPRGTVAFTVDDIACMCVKLERSLVAPPESDDWQRPSS
jgi:transcriptional regulator with XRE-family HTH domain